MNLPRALIGSVMFGIGLLAALMLLRDPAQPITAPPLDASVEIAEPDPKPFPFAESAFTPRDVDPATAVRFSGRVTGIRPVESVFVYLLAESYEIDFESPTWAADLTHDAVTRAVVDNTAYFAVDAVEPGTYALAAVAFTSDPGPGIEPMDTVRVLEQQVEIREGGAHMEFGF